MQPFGGIEGAQFDDRCRGGKLVDVKPGLSVAPHPPIICGAQTPTCLRSSGRTRPKPQSTPNVPPSGVLQIEEVHVADVVRVDVYRPSAVPVFI